MNAGNAARPLVITGVTLIDGLGGAPLPGAGVVIEDGRFSRVGPAAAIPEPDGAETIDGRGKFLIPGLVDMHVHTQPPERAHLSLFLAAGVTTVLDLGGQLGDLVPRRGALARGEQLGPRLLFTGPMLEEGKAFAGFAAMSREIDAEQIEGEIDGLAGAGADAVKLYITIRPQTARRAAARAHARGLRVFMHQQATWGADAADAGVDCLEHLMAFGELATAAERPEHPGTMTPFEYGGWLWRVLTEIDPRGPAVQRLYERLLAADTALDPTLVLFAARPAAIGDDAGDTSMDDPERTPLLPLLPAPVAEELQSRWAERRQAAAGASENAKGRSRRCWQNILQLVGGFHAAGGRVLAGTDCPNVAIVSGFSLHRELELLVRAGLSPLAALQAATRRAAERLDRQDEFGAIKPGLSADALLLDADPLADIRNTRRIAAVFACGRLHRPDDVLAGLRA
ncbi:MAG TPA: amidohydrolase family protein [Dehalococcoidia bacterium]|nr:amidohydrolase family protein [Dehalococcoidia bacterium]